jgi:predicted MFS family arabinose efflux permease
MLAPPLASWLIAEFGWRGAYLGLAAITAVLGLSSAALMEASPAGRGLGPDGDPPVEARPGTTPAGYTLKEALRTSDFRLLYASAVLAAFGLFIPFVHLAAYARDRGLGEAAAVWLVGLIGFGSLFGRFLIGLIADRIGRKRTMALCFAGLAAMMLLWLGSSTLAPLAVFAVVFGTCYGGFVALAPAIAADHFGGRAIGAIIGVYYSSVAFGTLLGPSAAGYAYDLTGSYTAVILGSTALYVLAVLIVLRLPRPNPP